MLETALTAEYYWDGCFTKFEDKVTELIESWLLILFVNSADLSTNIETAMLSIVDNKQSSFSQVENNKSVVVWCTSISAIVLVRA